MVQEDVLSGVRWRILEQLAHSPLTASELAKHAQTSLPAVSQAMKLLEARLAVNVGEYKGSGKPRAIYSLKKDLAHVTICAQGVAKKFSITPSALDVATLRAFHLPREDKDWVIQLLWTHRGLLQRVDAIAYVRSEKEETHLLVLTSDIDEYRKKYSHVILEVGDSRRKIISWSHTIREAKEGLMKKEKYFVDLFEQSVVLFDPKNVVHNICLGTKKR